MPIFFTLGAEGMLRVVNSLHALLIITQVSSNADINSYRTDVSYADHETIITPPCGRMSQRMRHAKKCLRTRAFFEFELFSRWLSCFRFLQPRRLAVQRGLYNWGNHLYVLLRPQRRPCGFRLQAGAASLQLPLSKQNNSYRPPIARDYAFCEVAWNGD